MVWFVWFEYCWTLGRSLYYRILGTTHDAVTHSFSSVRTKIKQVEREDCCADQELLVDCQDHFILIIEIMNKFSKPQIEQSQEIWREKTK